MSKVSPAGAGRLQPRRHGVHPIDGVHPDLLRWTDRVACSMSAGDFVLICAVIFALGALKAAVAKGRK